MYVVVSADRHKQLWEGDVLATIVGVYTDGREAVNELLRTVEALNNRRKESGENLLEVDKKYGDEYHYVALGGTNMGALAVARVWVEKVVMTRPFWSSEGEVLEARNKLWGVCDEAKTLGELVRSGVNAVRVFAPSGKYLGYGYGDERSGEPYIETEEEAEGVELTEDTPITNANLDRDDDGYTIITCDLVESGK